MTSMTKPNNEEIGPQQKLGQLQHYLAARKTKIEQAAGKLLDADRVIMLALMAVNKTPSLMKCTQESILQAVYDAGRLGLEPDGVQGAIVPYKGSAQFQPMYQGLCQLVYEEESVESIEARVAYDCDFFRVVLGTDPHIEHKPDLEHAGKRTAVAYYAVAHMRGRAKFDVMTPAEIDAIRARSPSVNTSVSPWKTDYEEMAKKTVLKRLLKTMPKRSRRLREALVHDNEIEAKEVRGDVIDLPATPEPSRAESRRERLQRAAGEPPLPDDDMGADQREPGSDDDKT